MNGPAPGDGSTGPDVDPDVLEELEFWTGPDPEDAAEEPGRTTAPSPGSLVVVGTPIGNLGDLSPRAVAALAGADVVYCEDTRHSRKLFSHAGITGASLRSLHRHNEDDRIDEVVRSVGEGMTVALVSDAGMPGVSDPGAQVVAAVAAAGLAVTVVPGPSAVLAALVGSGLPTGRFCFEGFLPRSGRERRSALAALAVEPRTTVLFEAPGRVAATLQDLSESCGPARTVSVARELTKLHEEFWLGTLAEAVAWSEAHPVRGEVVVVLAGAPVVEEPGVADEVLVAALADRLGAGERTRGVVDDVSSAFGVPRRRVYELALTVRSAPGSGAPSGGGPGDGAGPDQGRGKGGPGPLE
jgi:16S rRNA (cytidine1402-2'-O)-methyltransferase